MPDNIALVHLPPRATELNPTETVWLCLRQTWLSNRELETYAEIVEAWNKLVAETGGIASFGCRRWAAIGHRERRLVLVQSMEFPLLTEMDNGYVKIVLISTIL